MLAVPYTPLPVDVDGLCETTLFVEVARALGHVPKWGELVPVGVWMKVLREMGVESRKWHYVFDQAEPAEEMAVVLSAVAGRARAILKGTDPLSPEWEATLCRDRWNVAITAYYEDQVRPCSTNNVEGAWYILLDLFYKMPRPMSMDVPRPYKLLERCFDEALSGR